MNIEDIDKKILELNDAYQDISVQIEKLGRQKQALEARELLTVLSLFDFDFDFDISSLTLRVKDRKKENETWKALDKVWKHDYHDSIFLEENVVLRGDDGTYKLIVDKADYRSCGNPRELYGEGDMKILATFAKKYNLNIIYKSRAEEIKRHADSLKESQEQMLFFKNEMCRVTHPPA